MNPHVSPTSEAKRAANVANSAASTGPRTPQGKQRSKYNRLGHGLASPLAVLPCENQDEYDHLLSAFVIEHNPDGPAEEALVKQIADAQWKLRRLEKLETSLFSAMLTESQNEATAPPADPFDAIAAALLKPGKSQSALGLLARYQATLNRQFLSALKELRLLQRHRERDDCEEYNTAVLQYINGPTLPRPSKPHVPMTVTENNQPTPEPRRRSERPGERPLT